MADVFAMSMRLKEEGAAQVKAAIDKLGRAFTDATKKSSRLDNVFGELKSTMAGFATVAAIGTLFSKIAAETADAEFAAAQLNAALKSTAGVAGQSAEALNAHAQALSYVTAFDDDAITGAQALLLTFTKIGGETFPQATTAILDMAAAMNTDLKSATIQIGKALNDPILGVSALGRAGVQFSESQKEVIASLTETGRIAEAQGIILAELKTQFEGSAAAAANTFGGALKQLSNELGNLLTLSENNSKTTVGFIRLLTDSIIGLRVALKELSDNSFAIAQSFRTIEQSLQTLLFPLVYAVALLNKKGKEEREAAKAFAESVAASNKGYRGLLADAFESYQTRQIEIRQLIQLSTVKQLNTSQTKLLRNEAARLTKEMNRENLSLQGQYEIGQKLVEVQEALTVKKREAIKLAEVSDIGLSSVQFAPLVIMPFDVSILPRGGVADDSAKKAEFKQRVDEQLHAEALIAKKSLEEQTLSIAVQARDGLANVLGDALIAGIQRAFEKGANFGDAMKAFGTTLLAGLGNVMVTFGQQLVALGVQLKIAMSSFATGNPYGLIAAGLGIIAIGAALRGAASSSLNQNGFGGGGGVGGGFSAPAIGGGTTRLPGVTFGPTSSSTAGNLTAAAPINVTIIGPNDPSAQRQMQELIANAQRRGNV